MPELEDSSEAGVPRHLKEYFAGVSGTPPKPKNEEAQPGAAPLPREHGGAPAKPESAAVANDGARITDGTGATDEIARLRLQVAEKDEAIFHAVLSASSLKQQLDEVKAETVSLKTELAQAYTQTDDLTAVPVPSKEQASLSLETQAEVTRQRKEWMRIQKGLEREHSLRKAELMKVRGQWFQTQQQLEQESRARRMEGAHSSAKIANMERSLSTANGVISNSYRKEGSPNLKRGLVIALASITFLVVAGGVWAQFSPRAGAQAAAPAPATPSAMASTINPAITMTQTSARPSGTLRAALQPTAFSGSLGRLNEALSSFGMRSPEDVLRDVRLKSGDPSVCAFRWNKGQPALIFGKEGMKQSLAESLGGCAAAVEKYRP